MKREFIEQNVYENLQQRLKLIFEEFDNIYISFSGGKDSGLLLNLVLDYKRKYFPDKTIGVFHQDFEAQYTVTTEYVERTFERIKNEVEPYWVCLPMATRTALSSYEMYWYPWDDTKQESWVRKMPRHDYVINLGNNPITTYRYRMHQEDLAKQFSRWYRLSHGNKKTVCLLGMRADESLQRYSGFLNKKYGYKGECWIGRQFKDVWCASPLYDWIDLEPPLATLTYSKTTLTNEDVTVTIDFNENATVINNSNSKSYTFKENGEFTFEFRDTAGNRGTIKAKVNWIYYCYNYLAIYILIF